MKEITLTNSTATVKVDDHVYAWLLQNYPLLLENLREHSSGCAVYQKTVKSPAAKSGFETATYYLHKLLAEQFLLAGKTDGMNLVGCKDGNKLNCQLENIEYRTRATSSRQRKTSSHTGFTGVYQEHRRFRAIISLSGTPTHLGMYDTKEDAAYAYNLVSLHFYPTTGKVNTLPAKFQPSATFKRPAILPPPEAAK